MKIRFIISISLLLLAVLPMRAMSVWFNYAPTTASYQQSYYVGAAMIASGNNFCELWLNENYTLLASVQAMRLGSVGATRNHSGPATITYFAEAYDYTTEDYGYAYHSVSVSGPPNSAPSSSISATAVTLEFGEGSTVTGSLTDADGNLQAHALRRANGGGWVRPSGPSYTLTGWNSYSEDTVVVWSSLNHSNDTASGGSSTKSAVVRPPVGTWEFNTNGRDSGSLWAAGASVTITVNKATPSGVFAARNFSPGSSSYTVQATDLNAVFSNPHSGTVASPTGTITYSIVGPATNVTSGTLLPPGTYLLRASYPGDSNYNAASKDAIWTVNVPSGATDTSNDNELNIHRPN